jgi:hypothetical protein
MHSPEQNRKKEEAQSQAKHHAERNVHGNISTTLNAEEQLKEDLAANKSDREQLKSMESRRFWLGGGKNYHGPMGGGGVSDEELASKKAEIKSHDDVMKNQYLLRKRREAKEGK